MPPGRCCDRCGGPLEAGAVGSTCPRCDPADTGASLDSTHADETPSTRGALDLEAGHRLGDFVVQRRLGYGGMGVVYEATQVSLGRTVALKILPPARRLYTRGLELSPQSGELYEGRRELLHELGDTRAELADARRAVQLSPEQLEGWFNLWQALVQAGERTAANEVYRVRFHRSGATRRAFGVWLERWAFDLRDRGRPLPLLDDNLQPMSLVATQLYSVDNRFQRYHEVSRRIVHGGFRSTWSPDGRRLAFTRFDRSALGVTQVTPKNSGIGILELESGRVRTVVGSGKDPAWSPDGHNIAYVWEAKPDDYLGEEVWIVPAEGGQARRLAHGGFPSWRNDSHHLVYHSRLEGRLMEIDTADTNAPARPLTHTGSWYPALSPDGTAAAFNGDGELQIVDVQDGTLLAAWPLPTELVCLLSWSPDGRHISLGGPNQSEVGLWIYELETGHAWRVLEGPVTLGAWSPNGSRFAFDVRGLLWDIWVAEWPAGQSPTEAFPQATPLEAYLARHAPQTALSFQLQLLAPDLARLVGQARLCQTQGRTAESLAAIDEWSQRGGDAAGAHLLRAGFFSANHDFERAAAEYRAVTQTGLPPNTLPGLRLAVAKALVDGPPLVRNPSQGVALLRDLAASEGSDPELLGWLALAWARSGNATEAQRAATLAGNADPAYPGPDAAPAGRTLSCFVRAGVFASQERRTDAWAAYGEALASWGDQRELPHVTLDTLYRLHLELAKSLGALHDRFTDDFDGAVRIEWRVRHPVAAAVSLVKVPGALTVTTREGDIYALHTNLANAFLYPLDGAPGDFVATTCLTNFAPVVDWHTAGLLCYGDDDHYVKWVYQHIGKPALGLLQEMDAVPGLYREFFLPARQGRLWLRFIRRGRHLALLSSADGVWFELNREVAWGESPIRAVGLMAMNGTNPDAPGIDASFEFFQLQTLDAGR